MEDELGNVIKCSVEGCEKDASAKGLCIPHYKESRLCPELNHKPSATFEKFIQTLPPKKVDPPAPKEKLCADCGKPKKIIGRGLCGSCYWKHKNAGTLEEKFPAKWGKVAPETKQPEPETKTDILDKPNPKKETDYIEAKEPLPWDKLLLTKFPCFDPAWSSEIKAIWFEIFKLLLEKSSNL